MLRPGRFSRPWAGLAVAACALVTFACTAPSPPPTSPTITVSPDNVMVNTTVTVTGAGFTPGQTVHLAECGQTSWIAPQSPCTTDNAVTIVADSHGGFSTGMKAEVCPRPSPIPPPVTEAHCFVGDQQPTGVDTIELQYATSLIVTYP